MHAKKQQPLDWNVQWKSKNRVANLHFYVFDKILHLFLLSDLKTMQYSDRLLQNCKIIILLLQIGAGQQRFATYSWLPIYFLNRFNVLDKRTCPVSSRLVQILGNYHFQIGTESAVWLSQLRFITRSCTCDYVKVGAEFCASWLSK